MYKCIVVALAALAFAWALVDVAVAWKDGRYDTHQLAHSRHAPLLSNVLMAAGACAVLASLSWCQGSRKLDEAAAVLQAYAHQHELHELWMSRVKRDVAFVASMFIWAGAASFSGGVGSASALPFLQAAASFAVNTLLMLFVLFLLFVLRLLVVLADVFCFQLCETLHVSEAARDWNLLQAVLRKASAATQLGLLAFLAVAAFAIPAFMLDYMLLGPSLATLWLQLPHILVLFGVLRMFVMASTVTGKCTRVAPLINSLDFGPGTDRDSQDLVTYIQNSAAGFYIFDVRLTMGMVVKFMYVWAVVVFGVVSRGHF